MTFIDFIKPDRVVMLKETDNTGIFEFRPLEPGYGVTIGNAIRRVLLSSLEGYAVCSIKIDGVEHEFSTIPGVITDVSNIILNLKQVRFKKKKNINEDKETIQLHIANTSKITAKNINNALKYFDVLNQDLLIAETDESANFSIDINIDKGRGYVPADEANDDNMPMGTLPIDRIYTPIKSVKYNIDQYRVGQRTDYEKLTLEIVTDGSINPKNALIQVAQLLIQHFELFSERCIVPDENIKVTQTKSFNDSEQLKQLLDKKLQDLNFTVRSVNCLKQAKIITVRDLVQINRLDLLQFRNFGRKSLNELDEFLEKNGLTFGMDIANL